MGTCVDLTGKRFSKLVVLQKTEHRSKLGGVMWLCKCDCGNEREVSSADLNSGKLKSCGCAKPKFRDLTGKRFGRLVAMTPIRNRGNGNGAKWICQCDCGNITEVESQNLITGHTTSCGCYRIEKFAKSVTKHGESNSRIYRIWWRMILRCEKEKNKYYKDYGGRGIKVCEEWHDFEKFYKWAMNNGYEENLSIDRIDNDGNYCPENCRWTTWDVQARNKRNNVFIEYNGKSQVAKDWEKETGIKEATIRKRLKNGWSVSDALTTPLSEVYSENSKKRFTKEHEFSSEC